ncbi:MAG: NADH:flavin oxidoreductase [Acidobacteria bacterium]|nr:NADH:flavin oxidoreductase [Acidobacteriota bacterium]
MKLLEPFDVGAARLPNRVVLTAMVTRLSGEDGHVNREIRDRYVRFAKGEPGLIVLEAMAVHEAKSGPLLRIGDDRFLPGLTDLGRAIHDAGPSKVFPQIIHFLKISRSGWRQKISDLTLPEIRSITENYAAAAERARRAGFDGVELHMAHAYTLSSFLSARNARGDEYGRSLENRMRLPTEVIASVRRAIGDGFPLGVRFDAEECIKDGYTILDARQIALRFARLGADYLSLSAGGKFEDAIHKAGDPLYPYTGYSGDRCMPPDSYPDGANNLLAAGVKAFLLAHRSATPVVTTGKIRSPREAEEILARGDADLIGMARALLADPDWTKKVKENREGAIVRCIYGNVCKNLDENFKRVRCVLWPAGSLQAPQSFDTEAPTWPSGRELVATAKAGRISLFWKPAADGEAVYGYEVLRAEAGAAAVHVTSVKGCSYNDYDVVAGVAYTYTVRAYDLAGNRSVPTDPAGAVLSYPEAARERLSGRVS